MGYVVATGLVSVAVPGAWRRLSVISNDGLLLGLDGLRLVAQLEELGIPRHQNGLAWAAQSWRRAAVPPDVAFALWLLRDCIPKDGGIPRRRGLDAEDTGPSIRYLQLALAAGETAQTDPAIGALAEWLVERQLEDGGVTANLPIGLSEVGTTARALRVLRQIPDERLREPAERMRRYLMDSVVETSGGRAWSYGRQDGLPAVTGATSLAALALLETGPAEPLLADVFRFLLSVQHPSGGWSEVAGHTPTIHNTFNVVRALRAGRAAGIVGTEADAALHRAANWFRQKIRRQAPRSVLDLAYALRLAVQLDLLGDRAVERLGIRLRRQRSRVLAADADLYAETEIAAIALLECSRRLDSDSVASHRWSWRWALPGLPPPFLSRTTYLYELLYGVMRSRWWIRFVDYLVDAAIVDRFVGLLLGTIAAFGFVDDFVTSVLTAAGPGVRGVTTLALIGTVTALWLVLKYSLYSSPLRAIPTSLGSLVAAALLTWVMFTPTPLFPTLACLVGLRWLVIDVVAHTANASGLLNRVLWR